MDGDLAIRVPAWLIVTGVLTQVLARPLLRRLADALAPQLRRAGRRPHRSGLARRRHSPAAAWDNATPRRARQPRHVAALIDRGERHLARRLVDCPCLEAMRGDPDCGVISVLRTTVVAIRAGRRTLASLDATYTFAAALLPLAAWGPVYSVTTWVADKSSVPMMIAELTLKIGLLLSAITLGDPARSPQAVRISLDMLAGGVALSLVFSAYVDPGWLSLVATVIYKAAMAVGLVAIWRLRKGVTDMTAARWTFALAGVAEVLALPASTHEVLVLVALFDLALIVMAYRTLRSGPEFYHRIGGQGHDRTHAA